MKKIAGLIGFLALLMLIPASAEAQILKKLKERAKNAAERTILNRTESEISKGTDKAIDGILKGGKNKDAEEDTEEENEEDSTTRKGGLRGLLENLGEMSGNSSAEAPEGELTPEQLEKLRAEAEPPPADQNIRLQDTYSFSYWLTTELSTSQGKNKRNYLLQPGGMYYAEISTEQEGEKYIIYDNENLALLHFLETDSSTEFWREKMDVFTALRQFGASSDGENKQVKKVGKKEILGFTAQGYEIKTNEGLLVLWVTHEAPATIFGAMFSIRADEEGSPFQANDMILEMKFSAAENSNRSYHWVCTALEPYTKTFDITAYNQQ